MVAKESFLGSDDAIELTLYDARTITEDKPDGEPIKFIELGVTRMVLFNHADDTVLLDSDVSTDISFDNDGNITIKAGSVDSSLVTKFRNYETYVKSFGSGFEDGRVIIHPKRRDSNLSITFN